MKIAFFESNSHDVRYFNRALKPHKLQYFTEPLNKDSAALAKAFEAVSISIHSKLDAATIKKLPGLRYVCTRSTGFDHIDRLACKKQGILASNVPAYGEHTVAEHTFGLILNLSRNIHRSYLRTKNGDFSIEGLKGFDLENKTIGIVGGGRIGLHVAKIAKGFGMNVLVSDPFQNNFLAEIIGFSYCSLESLLRQSDIVSLHAPETPQTHHLIDRESIKTLKKGALLINTSRGGLVDIDALIWALDKQIVGGAGLDVIEGEEFIQEEKQLLLSHSKNLAILLKDHEIFKRDNVIFTPHIAFYSQEALDRILETTAKNILAFAAKRQENAI